MNQEFHTTIFLTSHDIGDIEKLCRRIIIINSGHIVLDDSMEHLKHDSDMPLENIITEIYKNAEGSET